MSWSYSGDPSTSTLDRCRFTIGDTISTAPIMQDEEIQFLIDTYPSENTLMYQLFRRAATLFARDIKRTLGPQTEDPTERLAYFSQQAEAYKALVSCSGLSLQKSSSPQIFWSDMQSNPPRRRPR